MPITMATARVNAAPLANRSASGTAARRRKDGMSAGARAPARSAVIARKRPAPATRAAPGIRLRLIGSGPERTPAPGLFANRLARSQSCMLSITDNIYRRASAGGAPAPRRPAATIYSEARLGRRGPSPATACSDDLFGSALRPAGPQPRDGLQRAQRT